MFMLTMLHGLAGLTWLHNHCQEQSFECTHIKWTCPSANAHSHTHTHTKYKLNLNICRWRFLQGQKCGWSYRDCGSCLKSKLLIGSTGTHKLEGIRHIQIEIPVQFCSDLLVQLFRLISVFIVICSYPIWIIVMLFILNINWFILINCSDGDE
jgi:hypothetical protein